MNETKEITVLDQQQLLKSLELFGMSKDLTDSEKMLYVNIAKMSGLNPYKREIHISGPFGIGKDRRLSIVVGYEVYIKRAERSGKLDGWKSWVEGEGNDMVAWIKIHRKDRKEPFEWPVYYPEAVQTTREGNPNRFWKRMPRLMLRKVAISQGFRLCFPEEIGGLPYTSDEMETEESIRNVTPDEPAIAVKQEEKVLTKTGLLGNLKLKIHERIKNIEENAYANVFTEAVDKAKTADGLNMLDKLISVCLDELIEPTDIAQMITDMKAVKKPADSKKLVEKWEGIVKVKKDNSIDEIAEKGFEGQEQLEIY
jgi:phage recombination protein Bet